MLTASTDMWFHLLVNVIFLVNPHGSYFWISGRSSQFPDVFSVVSTYSLNREKALRTLVASCKVLERKLRYGM